MKNQIRGHTIPVAYAKGESGNMRKKGYFQKLYKFDIKSHTYLIEVSLDDYDDIYDGRDPSPFRKRDIEDEFDDFIVNSSEDIPLNHGISIVLYLPVSKMDQKKEATLKAAYKNYYNYALERIHKEKLNLQKRAIFYLFLSILLLNMGYFFFKEGQSILYNVVNQGIIIGSWVFLWEFFTSTFIKRKDIKAIYRLYKRLYKAEIRFTYI